jgi:DNA polymerase II small subunit/DNA polymerase delta subunit B
MNDELEFKVGEDESPATVSIGEDGAAEVLDKPQAPRVETPSQQTGELEQYSEGVKKRIDKLTARLRETQRREQAALEYAKSVQARATQLEQQYMTVDSERLGEANGRVQTQVVALKQIIRKAREEGDIDTETEAQQRLTSLTMEQSQINAATQQRELQQQQWNYQQQVAAQQAAQQPQVQVQQEVDPRVEEWAERNPWYGRDTAMTHAAWGIHRQLIQVEGFDPSSEEYYDALDTRLRQTFPQKLGGQSQTQNNRAARSVQTVAPASRSSGVNNARRTVKLTSSQVAIAKKLGVPLEEYAKYVKD